MAARRRAAIGTQGASVVLPEWLDLFPLLSKIIRG